MKKNIMMRLSAVLLVAVLLTTCVISGTWAKYVTSTDNVGDTATVAKWGIKMTLKGDKVVYDDDATTEDATAKVLKNSLAAPGTHEKLADFTLTGTPAVAYEIAVLVNLDLGENWKVDGVEYCPLVFHVDGTDYKIGDPGITTVAQLEEAVVKAIKLAISGVESGTKQYNAGVAVPTTANDVEINWTWAYSTSDANDVKDTALGNAYNATIDFSLQVTVTQVD